MCICIHSATGCPGPGRHVPSDGSWPRSWDGQCPALEIWWGCQMGKPWENHGKMVISARKTRDVHDFLLLILDYCVDVDFCWGSYDRFFALALFFGDSPRSSYRIRALGWWLTYPSETIWVCQLGWWNFPQDMGKTKNVPKHQAVVNDISICIMNESEWISWCFLSPNPHLTGLNQEDCGFDVHPSY